MNAPSPHNTHTSTLIYKGLKTLAEDLNEVATDWFTLGLQLGIKNSSLKVLDSEKNTAAINFRKTLEEWLRNNKPTHGAIIAALRSGPIGHNALATKLDSSKGSFYAA